MLTQILFAVVMMFSAVAATTPDPAAPVLYVYSVGSIAKTTVILDGQELAKIKGYQIFAVKITRRQHQFELRSADKTPEPLIFNFADKDIYIGVGEHLGNVGFSSRAIASAKHEPGGIGYVLDATIVSTETGQKAAKKCRQSKIPTFSTGISLSYQTGNSHVVPLATLPPAILDTRELHA